MRCWDVHDHIHSVTHNRSQVQKGNQQDFLPLLDGCEAALLVIVHLLQISLNVHVVAVHVYNGHLGSIFVGE